MAVLDQTIPAGLSHVLYYGTSCCTKGCQGTVCKGLCKQQPGEQCDSRVDDVLVDLVTEHQQARVVTHDISDRLQLGPVVRSGAVSSKQRGTCLNVCRCAFNWQDVVGCLMENLSVGLQGVGPRATGLCCIASPSWLCQPTNAELHAGRAMRLWAPRLLKNQLQLLEHQRCLAPAAPSAMFKER